MLGDPQTTPDDADPDAGDEGFEGDASSGPNAAPPPGPDDSDSDDHDERAKAEGFTDTKRARYRHGFKSPKSGRFT